MTTLAIKRKREYQKEWYYKNKKKRIGQIVRWQTKKREKIGQYIKSLKLQGCKICGYKKSSWALDFHHLDSTKKDFEISGRKTKPLGIIKKELKKCILVCRNCHAEIHHGITII